MIEQQCPNCMKLSKWVRQGACEHCGYCPTMMDRVIPWIAGVVMFGLIAVWIWSQ